MALLVLGLGLLGLGRMAEAGEPSAFGPAAVVAGGLAIAGAHLLNRQLCRACRACDGGGTTGAVVPALIAAPAFTGVGTEEGPL